LFSEAGEIGLLHEALGAQRVFVVGGIGGYFKGATSSGMAVSFIVYFCIISFLLGHYFLNQSKVLIMARVFRKTPANYKKFQ